MELTQLMYFREVVLEENISRAAQKSYISQPALSNAISRLERELGVELIARQGNRIVITDAGKRFAEHVDKALREIDLGVVNARRIYNEHYITSRIAYATISAARMLQNYFKERPKVNVDTILTNNDQVRQLVRKRNVDFGIVWGDEPVLHVISQTIMCGNLFAIVNGNSPIARRDSISLEDLRDENILCSRIGLTKDVLSSIFDRRGMSAHISVVVAGNENNMFNELSRENIGVCFAVPMADLVERVGNLNIRFVPISDAGEIHMCLLRREDAHFSEETQDLYNYTVSFFSQHGIVDPRAYLQ